MRIQALAGPGSQWSVTRTGSNLHVTILDDGCGGDETEPVDFDLAAHTQASLIAAVNAEPEYAASKLGGSDATPAVDLDFSGYACPTPLNQGEPADIIGPV